MPGFGVQGRTGFRPKCRTEMHRWLIENGHNPATVARLMGTSYMTVWRHCNGWPMSKLYSRLYRTFLPGIPVPIEGACQLYERPLPIRVVPPLIPAFTNRNGTPKMAP